MFLDQLKDTEQVLFKYTNMKSNSLTTSTLLGNLAGINGAINEIRDQIDRSAEARKGIVPEAGMDRDKAEELYGQLSQLQSDLQDGLDVTEGKKTICKAAKEFTEAENEKWKGSVESKANTQVSLLQQLGKFTDNPENTSTILARLKTNLSQMPKDVQGIRDYGKVLQNAENIVNKVGGTPVVMGFIQKVTSGEAFLSDLNDEVKKWIKEHHLEQKLKVTL